MSKESGLSFIMKRLVQAVMVFIGGVAGYQLSAVILEKRVWPSRTLLHRLATTVIFMLFSAIIGFIIAPLFWLGLRKLAYFFEVRLQNASVQDLVISMTGLIIGLLVANLIAMPLARIPTLGVYISVLLNLTCGYLGLRFFVRRRVDIWNFLTNISDIKIKLPKGIKKQKEMGGNVNSYGGYSQEYATLAPKIVDTSALIDGRILDVAQTGFLEGTLMLPRFVLAELQGVADSTDPLRRSRGRRGLTVVTELQKLETLNVDIPEVTLKELERDKVDEALVVLARQVGGKVITTDYNLNKIAQIEGVAVLNVNDLSNSLKPLLLPGERVEIDIIRVGKENNQGVGYLDDGTMLVVEDGYRHIGERVNVTITSMLQTSAGRMVFGRIHP